MFWTTLGSIYTPLLSHLPILFFLLFFFLSSHPHFISPSPTHPRLPFVTFLFKLRSLASSTPLLSLKLRSLPQHLQQPCLSLSLEQSVPVSTMSSRRMSNNNNHRKSYQSSGTFSGLSTMIPMVGSPTESEHLSAIEKHGTHRSNEGTHLFIY